MINIFHNVQSSLSPKMQSVHVRACTAGQRDETSIALVFRDGNGFYASGWFTFVTGGEEVRGANPSR